MREGKLKVSVFKEMEEEERKESKKQQKSVQEMEEEVNRKKKKWQGICAKAISTISTLTGRTEEEIFKETQIPNDFLDD